MEKFKYYAIKIAAICVILFFLQNVYDITGELVLRSDMFILKPWTLVTSMFLHGGFEHLFYNMFALVMFGSLLEKTVGSKKFLKLYFITGIAAGLGGTLFYTAMLGASGAIYGVLGCLGFLRPKMKVWAYGAPMPMIVAVFLWALIDFIGLFAPGEVAYAAHLFGLMAGISFALYWKKQFKENTVKQKKATPIPDRIMRKWEDIWMR
ncbi:MAG: rhomboid family intramembrane serine protease [Candidatus Aenigmarchaeota archaeon]|nr:rhomboid family intramembrane serine protease [Candidatus Aenigmarchaeota archaeon]